ncbi:MAG: hypothetical protein H7144_17295 [Burkholderiales bacterium]|nr:hypothetical protein [Phycisphaerae bacterium]
MLSNAFAPPPTAPEGPTVAAAPSPAVNRPDLMTAATLRGVDVQTFAGTVRLDAAQNEWVSIVVQIKPAAGVSVLNLPDFAQGKIARNEWRAYQVLPMPVDVNRAGFVRHTGLPASVESLPRALIPLTMKNGAVDLAQLRDPRTPADPSIRGLSSGQPLLIWLDLHVPVGVKPESYRAPIALVDDKAAVQATLPVLLNVADFVLSDERHIAIVGEVGWDALKRHWAESFDVIQPNLLSRTDKRQANAVRTLDELVTLAEAHRVQVYVPRLQPTVKWPAGQPVQIDWSDFDGLVGPWMTGSAFASRVPLNYWPVPKIDYLSNIASAPRLEYYAAAAAHFDQLDWLRRAPIVLEKLLPGPAQVQERVLVSAEARRVLDAHPRVRVALPLELDEVQIADSRNVNLIDPRTTGRLDCVAPGLISSSPLQKWPDGLDRPQSWLRTDLRGLIPYAGAGADDGDVRVWAWMAFLRKAKLINWGTCLPSTTSLTEPADPNELTWFVPGSWFGVKEVVPTIQLKWLRRAEQDFEYLTLAAERGSIVNVLPMARVLSKPVEIQAGQTPDPTYSLLIGTADPQAWRAAQALLSQTVLLKGPGKEQNENELAQLNLQTLQWMEPIEKPVILPRTTVWTVGDPPAGEIGPWVNLRLGIDIYNASDTTPDHNELRFAKPAPGWVVQPEATTISKLTMFQVQRQGISARVDPMRVRDSKHAPVQIAFQSGYSGRTTPLSFIAPVARSMRRTAALRINGSLDEWVADDAVQLGPMVKMMSRPALQQHALEMASTPSELYSGWSDDDLFLSFRVEGLGAPRPVMAARNFVEYQYDRAWGEDLCQMILQAVYDDGTVGPLVHIAIKPAGNVWVERKLDPRLNVNPWQNFNPGVRYASTLEQSVWRGEMAIPWSSLIAAEKTEEFAKIRKPNLPTMLRFNFIQHKRDNGESASWAGPIDRGRDDSFTGVMVLKEP